MTSHGCACQRLDQIESQLIRLRALMDQRQNELITIRRELNLHTSHQEALDALALAKNGVLPLAEMEKEAIFRALHIAEPIEAAKLLGIGKTTLYRKAKEYGWNLDSLGVLRRTAELESSVTK